MTDRQIAWEEMPFIRVDLSFRLNSFDDSAVRTFDGTVVQLSEVDEDDETTIGDVTVQLVNTYDPRFFYDTDAESSDLLAAIEAVCDRSGIRESLYDGVGGMVLHIDRVVLEPPHRGRGIGLVVVHRILRRLGVGCALAVLQPAPVDPIESNEDARRLARHKLQRHWGQLGFKPVPRHRDFSFLVLG